MNGSYYKEAVICERGHVIKSYLDRGERIPDRFCATCGAPLVTECPNCQTRLRGQYHVDGIVSFGSHYKPPNYCFNCGGAMPWLQSALDALREIAVEDGGATDDEADTLVAAAQVLAREGVSAETQVAASRIRRIGARVGKKTEEAMWAVITTVASSAAKGQLGLD